jgi:hypothetical protein
MRPASQGERLLRPNACIIEPRPTPTYGNIRKDIALRILLNNPIAQLSHQRISLLMGHSAAALAVLDSAKSSPVSLLWH